MNIKLRKAYIRCDNCGMLNKFTNDFVKYKCLDECDMNILPPIHPLCLNSIDIYVNETTLAEVSILNDNNKIISIRDILSFQRDIKSFNGEICHQDIIDYLLFNQ